ncbi:MAG: bifunctional alpha,alpha-trehalose-phosphate synthase (UDP-forming)/trehalose-phosphatase [Gemmatimonadales bacterium]|nr:bifunctional alpha,alpha-trehalose-phosphate synthase (UDP-forming)/trehalose-phosphatase [Gemmatimonadales bacterium]
MTRVLIVANRLPVTVRAVDGGVEVQPSTGGLATGLLRPHEQSGGLWIGWSGASEELTDDQQAALTSQLDGLRLVNIPLTPTQVSRYYEGFANGVLWPLFHYLLGELPLHVRDWDAYVEVNERFAEVVAEHYRPGDRIWVHDYQLLLLPDLLRQRLPEARIGFFLHIPFPSEELFRTLPAREALLRGMLGADLVGFHTPGYLRHFASSLTQLLGLTVDVDRVQLSSRDVRLGVFPMGVDAENFETLAEDPAVRAETEALKGDGSVRLMVGVDRLDYTKGIPRRLLSYEKMLQDHPDLRERVRLVQVAVPSRTGVEAYQEFRLLVDGLVGRINGEFGTAHWVPVHYIFRGLSDTELVSLYRAADVMVVTPLRDGMNLVAKEFLAARTDGDGVLVLSEFAGASWELPEALQVNPYDVDGTAETFHRALSMSEEERRARLQPLRTRVREFDVHRWTAAFLEQLEQRDPRALTSAATPAPLDEQAARTALTRRLDATAELLVFLDYDGTLVPYAPTPDLARPDPGLLELLGALARRRETAVHVVSGRTREALEKWLGALPLALHAEHGFWTRARPGADWVAAADKVGSWREPVLAILRDVAARTPGSLVEIKSAALAWHYRMAEPETGARRANELRLHLAQLLSNQPVEILSGNKVVEMRPHGINKGRIFPSLSPERLATTAVLAMGDDQTDEDLFAAMPPDAISIRVGPGPTRAGYRIDGVKAARAILESLLERPRVTPTEAPPRGRSSAAPAGPLPPVRR